MDLVHGRIVVVLVLRPTVACQKKKMVWTVVGSSRNFPLLVCVGKKGRNVAAVNAGGGKAVMGRGAMGVGAERQGGEKGRGCVREGRMGAQKTRQNVCVCVCVCVRERKKRALVLSLSLSLSLRVSHFCT